MASLAQKMHGSNTPSTFENSILLCSYALNAAISSWSVGVAIDSRTFANCNYGAFTSELKYKHGTCVTDCNVIAVYSKNDIDIRIPREYLRRRTALLGSQPPPCSEHFEPSANESFQRRSQQIHILLVEIPIFFYIIILLHHFFLSHVAVSSEWLIRGGMPWPKYKAGGPLFMKENAYKAYPIDSTKISMYN
jgi:hypothetical protein